MVERMGIGCAAAPTFSSDRASGTISVVRAHAFASLSLLLDQHEDDEVLEQHERGQRALRAARLLATARTRAEENNAHAALIAIALEDR